MSSPRHALTPYSMSRYIMFDQAHNKVGQIMRERPGPELVSRPSWLALTLLVVAFNIIAVSST